MWIHLMTYKEEIMLLLFCYHDHHNQYHHHHHHHIFKFFVWSCKWTESDFVAKAYQWNSFLQNKLNLIFQLIFIFYDDHQLSWDILCITMPSFLFKLLLLLHLLAEVWHQGNCHAWRPSDCFRMKPGRCVKAADNICCL